MNPILTAGLGAAGLGAAGLAAFNPIKNGLGQWLQGTETGESAMNIVDDLMTLSEPSSSALSNSEAMIADIFKTARDYITHEVTFNRQNREFNEREAHKLREWQEYMSNTSYQRAMADMKAAGLNPILAYQQGGASTPGGSAASYNTSAGFSTDELMDNIGAIIKYVINKFIPSADSVASAVAGMASSGALGG